MFLANFLAKLLVKKYTYKFIFAGKILAIFL